MTNFLPGPKMTPMQEPTLTRSARALVNIMEEAGDLAAILRREVGDSNLSKYRNGKGRPGADMAPLIEELTGGLVPANGWRAEDGGR